MERSVDFKGLTQEYRPYGIFIISCGVVLAAISLIGSLASPKIYQGAALVVIPGTPKQIITRDIKGNVMAIVNVSETRALINLIIEQAVRVEGTKAPGISLLAKASRVRVDEIRGSNSLFKLTVQARGRADLPLLISDELLERLNANRYIQNRLNIDKPRATKPEAFGSTAPGMGTESSLVHGYQYLEPPPTSGWVVGPRPIRDLILYGVLGLMLGLLTAMLIQFVRALNAPGRS